MEAKKKVKQRKWLRRIITLIVIWIIINPQLKTTNYSFESTKVDKPIKIALLTDLHGSWYGKEQRELIRAIDKNAPDVVLLGGDIFDDNVSYKKSEETIALLAEKYPCYYVTGNHEYWSNDIENILSIIHSYGVTILRGEVKTIDINGQKVNIGGIDDPDNYMYEESAPGMVKQLVQMKEQRDNAYYSILLSHRPEYFETYSKYGYDLTLTGHAHGGQWRIPGILNGLFAPDQGLFPQYAGGLYEYESGAMIVSRGLDRWGIKLPRIFNRPELVIVEIN